MLPKPGGKRTTKARQISKDAGSWLDEIDQVLNPESAGESPDKDRRPSV